MAATAQVTDAFRRQMRLVSVDTIQQTVALWRAIDPTDVDRAWPVISRALTGVIAGNYSASTALAVSYLQAHAAAAGVDVAPLTAEPLNLDRLATSLQVTGPVAVKQAAASGQAPERAAATALVRLSGAASRLAQAGGRVTVERTVRESDHIVGFRRETSSHACYFCALLASRGAVYKTAQTASSRGAGSQPYHDHCSCTPVPLYSHEDEPAHVQDLYQRYLDATAGHSGKAAVAAWRQAYTAA